MWTTKANFSSYMQEFPTRETSLVQLGAGPLGLKTRQVWGREAFISAVSCKPHSVWHMLAAEDWVSFTLPLSWRGDYRLNGRDTNAGEIYFLDGRKEFSTAATDRTALMVGIRRERLARDCAALTGKVSYKFFGNHKVLSVGNPALVQFRRIAMRAFSTATTDDQSVGKLFMLPVQEADLISALAAWMLQHTAEAREARLEVQSDFHIVHAARACFDASAPDSVSLASLCQAAGVGKSTLHRAFVAQYGVSPMQYLQKMRLTAVREWLQAPVDPPTSVKQAALRYGFTSFGRFSRQYHALFGELPSETLIRNRMSVEQTE